MDNDISNFFKHKIQEDKYKHIKCNNEFDKHHLKIWIKGHPVQTLNKCGHPECLVPGCQAVMVRGYVASQYKDLLKSMDDIEKIQGFCGRKKVMEFTY